mgnify:CR=1 FL=1
MNFARLSRNWAAAFSIANIATLWILFGGAFIIATAGKSKELEINGQIRDREVRLIGVDGEQKGVVSIQVAMRAAEDAGLDLVKIAPQAVPPVCKVLDYGKYRFEQQKKEKEAKKNQKVVEVKETRLSLQHQAEPDRQVFGSWPQGESFDPLPWPRDGAQRTGCRRAETLCRGPAPGKHGQSTGARGPHDVHSADPETQ